MLCSCSCCSFGLAFTPSHFSHPAPGKLCILPDSAQVPPFCHAASDLYSLKWLKTTHLFPCHNTFRKQRRKSKSAVMYIPNWLFSVCFFFLFYPYTYLIYVCVYMCIYIYVCFIIMTFMSCCALLLSLKQYQGSIIKRMKS